MVCCFGSLADFRASSQNQNTPGARGAHCKFMSRRVGAVSLIRYKALATGPKCARPFEVGPNTTPSYQSLSNTSALDMILSFQKGLQTHGGPWHTQVQACHSKPHH